MHPVFLLTFLLTPLAASPAALAGSFPVDERPPAAWAPADTADALYRDARRALNGNELARAASLFNRIHAQHPRSAYAPDAFYWEAFARHRLGGNANLRSALALLEEQGRRHPDARTRGDARALETRVRGSLAEAGDRASSERLARDARDQGAGCEDAPLRAAALVALARSEPDRATDLARDVLRRRDECSTALREQAVHLLARQRTDEATAVLRNVVRSDPERSVQEAALHSLARATGSLEAMIDLYGELDDVALRQTLLYSISRADQVRAGAFLRERVLDRQEDRSIREAALNVLGRSGSLEDLIALYPRLESQRLREVLLYRIAREDEPASLRFLRQRVLDTSEDRRLREVALFQLVRESEGEGIPILIEVARSAEDRRLREVAIHALGRSDDPRARRFLRALVTQP